MISPFWGFYFPTTHCKFGISIYIRYQIHHEMFILHTFRSRALLVLMAALIYGSQSRATAQELTVSLSGSMHNGSSIPCFGKKEGTIVSTVTGGTAPYYYTWSNGAATPNITGVSAGFYSVDVKDADGTVKKAVITLTEPEELKVKAVESTFPNGHNISCFECNNGTIQVIATQGTAPYSYTWEDGPSTAANRYGLGPKAYKVTVTDANGCEASTTATITQPERSDWTMSGNAGTNPATQYIGTSDDKDVVFKANGQESLRLLPDGTIKLFGANGEEGPLYRDSDGTLRMGGPIAPDQTGPCALSLIGFPYWQVGGNSFSTLCEGVEDYPRIGTTQFLPLHVITADQTRMVVDIDGKVGIGTVPPTGSVNTYRLFVEGGIATRDVMVKAGEWPDYVFQPDYALMPLDDLRSYLNENSHLPGIPSAAEVEEQGGVEVGDLQVRMLRALEEQGLYILQLEERLKAAEERLNTSNTTK